MNPFQLTSPALILSLSLLSTAALAASIDPACEPVVKAIDARISQKAWKTDTIVDEANKISTMKVGGKFYKGRDGKWFLQPINLDEQERTIITQIRNGTVSLANCEMKGEEKIDGVDTNIISMTLQAEGTPAIDVQMAIGKNDGLPYAQTSEHVKTTYRYKNLFPPKLSK
jgi:hypothetical protein